MTKLDMAMAEIKTILDKHDIAGVVILHYPGESRSLLKVDPSYSACSLKGELMTIRAKLSDFKGDKDKHNKKLADTSNMLKLLSEVTVDAIYPIYNSAEVFDDKLKTDKLGQYAE